MNQELMRLLHDVRNKLHSATNLVHMHMNGDERYKAERLLDEAKQSLNKMYIACLQCDEDDRRET